MDGLLKALHLRESPPEIPDAVRNLPVQLVAREDRPPRIELPVAGPRGAAPQAQPEISTWTWMKNVMFCRNNRVYVN